MTFIRLHMDANSEEEIRQFIAAIDGMTRPSAGQIEPIRAAVRDAFIDNFRSESGNDAPWANLRPFTQHERERLGFPPAHPILFRTGTYLESFVDPANPSHTSEISSTDSMLIIEEGSADPRALSLEFGHDHMRARPVTMPGQAGEDRILAAIENVYLHWFDGV